MKQCSMCRELKQRSEFYARTASKDGLAPICKTCKNKRAKQKYKEDEDFRNKAKARVKGNAIGHKLTNKKYYEKNKEAVVQRVARNHKKRCAEDPIYKRAWNQWRVAKKLGRVPKWVSFTKDMLPMYEKLLRGRIEWSIDHVIPLNGEIVSGLHVPGNLQALPLSDNVGKSNHFNPDLFDLMTISYSQTKRSQVKSKY